MRKLVFIFFVLLYAHFTFGQGTANLIMQNQNFNSLKDGVGNFDYVYKIAPRPPDVNGSPYLFDTWNEAVIKIKDNDNEYRVPSIKYDILGNKFEFNYDTDIKVLNGSKVQRFEVLNANSIKKEAYVSCDEVIKTEKLSGFCQVLTEGAVDLITRKSAYVMNPTYNATLMVGNKDKEIIITDEYYLSDDRTTQRVKDKGDIKSFFKDLDFDPKNYKKSSIKDLPQLVEVINNYNQSVKK